VELSESVKSVKVQFEDTKNNSQSSDKSLELAHLQHALTTIKPGFHPNAIACVACVA